MLERVGFTVDVGAEAMLHWTRHVSMTASWRLYAAWDPEHQFDPPPATAAIRLLRMLKQVGSRPLVAR